MSNRRNEDGQTLPLVALVLVTLMVAAALAVDIGSLAATNRRLQGVADLAAIDGARELTGTACNDLYTGPADVPAIDTTQFDHVVKAVVASARRNGFEVGGDRTLVVKLGNVTRAANGVPTFTALPDLCGAPLVPDSVQVRAGDRTAFSFAGVIGQGGRTTTRAGVATRQSDTSVVNPIGGFRIGSSLAGLNSSNSPVLNSVLNGMVCRGVSPCSFNTTLVGYQGLASASVTLGQLQTQLGAGSVDALLNSEIKVRDLYLATAKALGCTTVAGCSNTAAVTLLGLSTSVTSTATFKLRDMITVASGGEDAAAASSFNVLELVTGSAQVINGTNTVSVPVTTVTIPGSLADPTSTTLSISVIERPKQWIGAAGPQSARTTSQVVVNVTQKLNLLNIPITGSLLGGVASVTGTLPVKVTAGSATGTLEQVNCAPTKGEVVSVDTTGATTAIGDANAANKFLNVMMLDALGLPVRVAGANVNATSSVAGVNDNILAFSYPSEYEPAATDPRSIGGTTLNVQNTAVSSSLDVVGLSLDASAVTSALTGPGGLVTTLDDAVISPVLRAMGITVGGADVWAIGEPGCGTPVLSG